MVDVPHALLKTRMTSLGLCQPDTIELFQLGWADGIIRATLGQGGQHFSELGNGSHTRTEVSQEPDRPPNRMPVAQQAGQFLQVGY